MSKNQELLSKLRWITSNQLEEGVYEQIIALFEEYGKEELEEQHQRSRVMAYRDIESSSYPGNQLKLYAGRRANDIEASLQERKD